MLAAQCNKLSSKSPPPLADAAVGKGFHPWKKSPSSTGQQSPGPIVSCGGGGGGGSVISGGISVQRSLASSVANMGNVTPR